MVQNIFDSHAHYDDERFDEDRAQVLAGLAESGVSRVLNVGCDLTSSQNSIALADAHTFMYASVGVHPHNATDLDRALLDTLAHMTTHPKVCALGEIGLDYYYDYSPRDIQKRAFEEQLALAKELDIPVIIHSRDAAQDTMEILKKYRPKGIVHCYSGSLEMAKEILHLDMYLGFTGVLTFKNARKAVEVVDYAPVDRLLIETDCPYMAPEPCRGQRCDSTLLQYTVAKMAEIKGLSPQEMTDITHRNACTIYGIAL